MMNRKYVLLGLLSCVTVLCGVLYTMQLDSEKKINPSYFIENWSEDDIENDLERLTNAPQNFVGVREFLVALAQEKGGVYAFELLKRAPVPPNTDLHLLGHAVGDELYMQQGLEGMQYCTHDFRNACSHSIVIGALLEDGMSVFEKVNDVCKLAPGGSGAYTMCFHGFGHGVLAYAEYELPDAVELCKKVGTAEYGNEETAQCIGGIVMEMHQGLHDPEVWLQKKDKYLDPQDPIRLCEAAYMPEYAKVLCYSYITPFIFDAAGAQGGNPTPDIYPKSFTYCDEVENARNRRSCYGGLGKEFVVLSQDRDIRTIEDASNENLERTTSWCMLAHKEEAQISCILSALDSLYWGGENDPEVSIRYCSLQKQGPVQDACFEHLFSITQFYQQNPEVRKKICESVPAPYQSECVSTLKL